MRDGHDGYDGGFGIPPAIVTVTGNVCGIGGSARSVAAMTVMAFVLGHPAAATLRGEHPINAKCRRGIYSPLRLVKPPLRSEKSSDFSDCVYRV